MELIQLQYFSETFFHSIFHFSKAISKQANKYSLYNGEMQSTTAIKQFSLREHVAKPQVFACLRSFSFYFFTQKLYMQIRQN